MPQIQEDKNIKTLDSQLQEINEDWKKTTIFTQINKYITTKNISYLTE